MARTTGARMSGNRWLGILIAVIAIGGLGLYASNAASHPAVTAVTATAAATSAASGTAVASTDSPVATPAPSPAAVPGMSASTIVGLVLKIGIVAALLGLCLWLLRRYAGTSSRSGGRTGAVSIVDTIPLAQGRAMYVLDIGDRALVVGATSQQFSLLGDVTDAAVLARLRGDRERSQPSLGGISRQLSGLVQRVSSRPDSPTPAPRERRPRTTSSDFNTPAPEAAVSSSFAATLANYAVAEANTTAATPVLDPPQPSPPRRQSASRPPQSTTPAPASASQPLPPLTGIAAQQRADALRDANPAARLGPARPLVPVERLRAGEVAL